MAAGTALLLVPVGGGHAQYFPSVALDLRKLVYNGRAVVYVVTPPPMKDLDKDCTFKLFGPAGNGFSGDFEKDLPKANTIVTVSHLGELDGPVMDAGNQPWGIITTSYGLTMRYDLNQRGFRFWQKVGNALCTRKIILCGCSGGDTYNQAVANVAGVPVYGYRKSQACAATSAILPDVQLIEEKGVTPQKMTKAGKHLPNIGPILHVDLYNLPEPTAQEVE
jgi:hypothetical protein